MQIANQLQVTAADPEIYNILIHMVCNHCCFSVSMLFFEVGELNELILSLWKLMYKSRIVCVSLIWY